MTTLAQTLTKDQVQSVESGARQLTVNDAGQFLARDHAGHKGWGRSPRLAIESLEAQRT